MLKFEIDLVVHELDFDILLPLLGLGQLLLGQIKFFYFYFLDSLLLYVLLGGPSPDELHLLFSLFLCQFHSFFLGFLALFASLFSIFFELYRF